MTRRQPLEARVWGRMYRSWYPAEGRQKRRGKRRSAKRERWRAKIEIRENHDDMEGSGSNDPGR
jgi:hypothetical protein